MPHASNTGLVTETLEALVELIDGTVVEKTPVVVTEDSDVPRREDIDAMGPGTPLFLEG